MNISPSKIAQPLLLPFIIFCLAFIWISFDIGSGPPFKQFSWSSLRDPANWFVPVTFRERFNQPKQEIYPESALISIYCLPEKTKCWAVGENGAILFTANGNLWIPQVSRKKEFLTSVYFINENEGWVTGWKGTLLHTKDGGRTWISQVSNTENNLNSVSFVDDSLGWAAGSNGVLLHTKDGGMTWAPQKTNTDEELMSLNFTSAKQGWVASWEGSVFHTEDGGDKWTQQVSKIEKNFTSLNFINNQQGWVTQSDGILLKTEDGGKNWTQQIISKHRLTLIKFIDSRQGWAIGFGGTLLHTEDGGKNWASSRIASNSNLMSASFINSRQGWVTDENGIWQTENGGKSWTLNVTDTNNDLTSVSFINTNKGWVVGLEGSLLHTEDGGKTWIQQVSNIKNNVKSVKFINANQGWVTGWDTLLYTRDGGKIWEPQKHNDKQDLHAINFLDADQGWLLGWNGIQLHTGDGGKTWLQQVSNIKESLKSVSFINSSQGWGVDSYRKLWRTEDGGRTWVSQLDDMTKLLSSVSFVDSNRGWVVGDEGIILYTVDGGKSWEPQISGTNKDLNSVSFINKDLGWIVGQTGTLLRTQDGGKTWIDQSLHNKEFYKQLRDNRFGPYHQWPSPASTVVFLLSLLWLISRIRKLNETPSAFLSTENGGITDAPLEFPDQDKLNYAPLSKGLAKLIRNIDTKPPLAIGLTAPWGVGKSSVLNMLKQELDGEAKTVFFNAWHYRNDEQILAALIEHIRDQAVPSGISLENVIFRARLFWLRAIRPNWQWWFVALPVFVAVVSYLGEAQDLNRLIDAIKTKMNWLNEDVKSLLAFFPVSLWLFVAAVILIKFRSSILDFLLKPVASFSPALVSELKTAGKELVDATKTTDRNWDNDAGIRYQFQKDFNRICQALGSHRLVILIDDLDRCEYHYIEKIVGTLNFLFSNNSKCYVVMALDWGYVKTALGLAYKEMAKATDDSGMATLGIIPSAEVSSINEAKVREEFAEKYLRKIIQIRVALPDRSLADLLSRIAEPQASTEAFPYKRLLIRVGHSIKAGLKRSINYFTFQNLSGFYKDIRSSKKINILIWLPYIVLKFPFILLNMLFISPFAGRARRHLAKDIYRLGNIFFITVCFSILGTIVAISIHSDETVNGQQQVQPAVVVSDNINSNAANNTKSGQITDSQKSSEPLIVLERQKNSVSIYFLFIQLILGGVLILWIRWFVHQERDSSEFRLAMHDWRHMLEPKIGSPREWRRLENNVRFFMMMSRSMDYRHPFDRFKDNLKLFKNKLIKWAEGEDWPVSEKEEFDEGLATRLLLANIYTQGKLGTELFNSGGGGLEALAELSREDKPIDRVLGDFLSQWIEGNPEHQQFIEKWLAIFAFKLQLPQIKEKLHD